MAKMTKDRANYILTNLEGFKELRPDPNHDEVSWIGLKLGCNTRAEAEKAIAQARKMAEKEGR